MKAMCRAVLTAAAMLVLAGASAADTYPVRPVRVILPQGVGGVSDTVARLIAQKLSENLGRPFYPESQAGAGGNIGMAMAAKAAPDGYTLLAGTSTLMVNPHLYARLPFDPVKDFAPVTVVGISPFVLLVHPTVPAQDAAELVTLIKANPGKYTFASPGVGTTPHLLGELLRLTFSLDLVHVPFTNAASTIASVVAGHTPIYFGSPFLAVPHVREGKLRALAVTSRTRVRALPDVPTVTEAGLPGEGADTIVGFLAPNGTPSEIIDLLYREIGRIIALPDVKERFGALGFEPVGNTPGEFAALIKADTARWGKLIRDANIRGE